MPHTKDRIERLFLNLLDRFGRYSIYVRRDDRFLCSCWNPDTKEADPHHTLCLGTGHKIQVERFLSILQISMPAIQQEFAQTPSPIGIMGPIGTVIFLERGAWPRVNDLIFEVEWDCERDSVLNYGRVARLVDSYTLQSIDRISDSKGEIIVHKCYSHTIDSSYQWYEDALKDIDFTWDPQRISGILYDV